TSDTDALLRVQSINTGNATIICGSQSNGSALDKAAGISVVQANATVFNASAAGHVACLGISANPVTSGALSTPTFSSGVGKQLLTTRDVFLIVPCTLNPTAGAAGTVAVALSPDNVTYS